MQISNYHQQWLSGVFLFAFTIIGCQESNSVQPITPPSAIVPLTVGNSWTFNQVGYDTLGNILGSEQLNSVVRDSIVAGHRLFVYSTMLCLNTDTGLVYVDSYYDTTLHFQLFYKYHTKPGDIYFYDYFSHVTFQVGSIDTLIHVPAGTFHCISYKIYGDGVLEQERFLSPSMGLVRGISYGPLLSGKTFTTVTELTGYFIK